ncbi:MAG: hypothetical protein KTR21_05160 [Rhodobacteraceae bacterium]|nr:hypothetical protein [Paracoccaceae bacterium]
MQSHMVLFRAAIEDNGDHTPNNKTPSLMRDFHIPLRELKLIGATMAVALVVIGYASQQMEGLKALLSPVAL